MSIKREIRDYLADILEAINDIDAFTSGMTYEEFSQDKKTINAVIRSLEIVGEATKKIPPEIRNLHPDLPWKEIAGMRDKLIHEYFGVDLQIVWMTIQQDLNELHKTIQNLVDPRY